MTDLLEFPLGTAVNRSFLALKSLNQNFISPKQQYHIFNCITHNYTHILKRLFNHTNSLFVNL